MVAIIGEGTKKQNHELKKSYKSNVNSKIAVKV